MGLFDSLMEGARSLQEKFSPAPKKNESVFTKLGRIPLTALGMAPSMQSAPEELHEEEVVPEELPVGELPPIPSRDIPEGSQIVGQEALDLYPEGSDVHNIIKNGYSIVTDPTNGTVIGMGDEFGHLLSPDEAMNPKSVSQTLQENGFHPIPENVDRFLKQNDNVAMDARELNFTGLKPLSNNVVVKSPIDTIMDTVWQTPILQTISGLKTPLQILGEGFNRYESLKASLIQDAAMNPIRALTNAGKSFAGDAESEFPDASLRNSKQPELGDLFRKMGAPELMAAVGGLGLDVLSDLGLGAISGKYLKQALQAYKFIDKGGNATDGLKYTTEWFNKIRSEHFTKEAIDMAKGKRSTDIEGSAAFAKTERAIFGKKNVASHDAEVAADEVDRIVNTMAKETIDSSGKKVAGKDIDELYSKINDMIHDKNYLEKGGDVPSEVNTYVRGWAKAKDEMSRKIADKYTKVINQMMVENPEWVKEVQLEMSKKSGLAEGQLIPIEKIPSVIAENDGNYVKLAYEMFQPNWIAPKEGTEKYANLLSEFIEEYGMTEATARKRIEDISSSREIHFPERSKILKTNLDVNKGSFVARQQISKSLREFMGEIKNPIFNMKNTTRNLADTLYKLNLFDMINDAGLASKEYDKALGRIIQVKGDSIAWGAINDKFISEELNDLITTVRASDKLLEEKYLKGMQFIKAMKTTMNPPGHFRQSVQNLGATAGLAGVSPFNPKNWKGVYWGENNALSIIWDAVKQKHGFGKPNPTNLEKYREMVEGGLLGVELPTQEFSAYMNGMEKAVREGSLDMPSIVGSASDILSKISKGIKFIGKVGGEAWAMEDMVVKVAAYLKKTRAGMKPADAIDEIFKVVPNYREASRLSKYVRNSPTAMIFLTPFFTFKSEAHRIMLNVIKEGTMEQKIWLAGTMGGRFALNTAMLSAAGNGLKDIKELYMSKPELISESMMNPAAMESGEFDINTKYIDPFNSAGIFAPLLAHAGATGVNPLDYMLDFTNFSPEFGYGSIVPDSVEALLTGRGKFGQELSTNERIMATIQGVGPSVLTNIPKVFDESLEPEERVRKALKLVGIDTEKRASPWIKSSVKKRLEQKIANKEDPTATINAIKEIGFDPDIMLKSIEKKLAKVKPIEKKKMTAKDEAVGKALASFGF